LDRTTITFAVGNAIVARFPWLADNILNLLAYVSLRVRTPLQAKVDVERVAAIYPQLRTVNEALRVLQRLRHGGSCLSRSLSIAARFPDAQVVIGVMPPAIRGRPSVGMRRRRVEAHAWVDVRGVILRDDSGSGWVELGRMDAAQTGGG